MTPKNSSGYQPIRQGNQLTVEQGKDWDLPRYGEGWGHAGKKKKKKIMLISER